MRIILDANVFVSAAISPTGACGKILKAVLGNPDEFELILTEMMVNETVASLHKPRIVRYLKHGHDPKYWMTDISSLSTMVPDVPISFDGCRDPDDVVYLAANELCRCLSLCAQPRAHQKEAFGVAAKSPFFVWSRQAESNC